MHDRPLVCASRGLMCKFGASPSVLVIETGEVNLRTFDLRPTAFRPHFSAIANAYHAEASHQHHIRHPHGNRPPPPRGRAPAELLLLLPLLLLLLFPGRFGSFRKELNSLQLRGLDGDLTLLRRDSPSYLYRPQNHITTAV